MRGAAAALALLAAGAANADEGARLALGKKLFTSATPPCALCHTLRDAGTTGKIGPPLDELQPDAEQVATALRQGSGVMPAYREKLSEEEILALARYVSRAARSAR
jgi:sulfite dehydrogenase